jgi:PPOX class probable F420-dependent enzyme
MPDGQPHATPIWCTYDGTHVIVNTARGRQKDLNMQRNPRVTLLAVDSQDDYRYIQVQGVVDEETEEGSVEGINQLSELYTGKHNFYGDVAPTEQAENETRVIYKIKPTKVITAPAA